MYLVLQAPTLIPKNGWQLLLIATPATKVVLLITAVLSLYSWFVIALKGWQFLRLKAQAWMTGTDRSAFSALAGRARFYDIGGP